MTAFTGQNMENGPMNAAEFSHRARAIALEFVNAPMTAKTARQMEASLHAFLRRASADFPAQTLPVAFVRCLDSNLNAMIVDLDDKDLISFDGIDVRASFTSATRDARMWVAFKNGRRFP